MVRSIILRLVTYEFHHIQVDSVPAVSRNTYAVAYEQHDWQKLHNTVSTTF